ncbi:MAG: hypothetical protein HY754_00265 [Nitrospirae bacterium]|nr:hypothetical protein [Nitrospirota bacterium]
MKKIAIIFVVLLLGISLLFIVISKSRVAQEAAATDSKNAEFQKLQAELNSIDSKQSIVVVFQKTGLQGLTPEDIFVTLQSYSYHYTDDSGKPKAYVIARCSMDISKFKGKAEELRKHIPSHFEIELPPSNWIFVAKFDPEKHKLSPAGLYDGSLKPLLKFVELRKDAPEYFLLSINAEDCDGCVPDDIESNMLLYGYDRVNKKNYSIFRHPVYKHGGGESVEGTEDYIDRSEITWSDWINNEYREVIVVTKRKIGQFHDKGRDTEFKVREEIYSWKDNELYLAEQIDDGKVVLTRADSIRLYQVRKIRDEVEQQKSSGKRPSDELIIGLIAFLGDSNQIIMSEAKQEIRAYEAHISSYYKGEIGKAVINALLQKIVKGTSSERKNALDVTPPEIAQHLTPEDVKVLISSADEKRTDIRLLRFLGYTGNKDVLPSLINALEGELRKESKKESGGCDAGNILYGLRALAEHGVQFSENDISVIKKATASPMYCYDGEVAEDANEVLKILKGSEVR